MRDALSRGIYVAPPRREDFLDKMAAARLQEEQIEKKRQAAEAKRGGPKDEALKGIERFAGVWDRDVEGLAQDFSDYKSLRVKYEQEKDPIIKAKLGQEAVQAGIALESNIAKSKKNRQEHQAVDNALNKDKGFLYPENSRELLDKWASTPLKERPDEIGVSQPSDIDVVRAGRTKFMESVGKPNERSTKKVVDGKVVTRKESYYTPEDVDNALEAAYNALKPNEIRTMISRMQQNALDGPPEGRAEAMAALQSEESRKAYIKDVIRAYVTPGLNVQSYGEAPVTAGRGGGGGAGGGRELFQVKKQAVIVPGSGGTKQNYLEITSSKKSGANPQKEWVVPTAAMKEYDTKYNYNLGFDNIDPATQPQSVITGTFVRARRAVDNPNDIVIQILPKPGRSERNVKTRKPIEIPYFGNEDEVSVYLNGMDLIDAFDQIQPSEGTELVRKERGTGAEPTFVVPRGEAEKKQNPLDGFKQFKR